MIYNGLIKKCIFYFYIAPGSYDVEKVNVDKTVSSHQAAPAYSFGQKYKDKRPDDVPGKKTLLKDLSVDFIFNYYLISGISSFEFLIIMVRI